MRLPQSDRGGTSLRAQRLRALAPRLLFLSVVAILGLNGLRAIFTDPAAPIARAHSAAASRADVGVHGFAEAFARAYLTWDAEAPQRRAAALEPFVGDADTGLHPGDGTSQRVTWTTVVATVPRPGRTLVTVAARTDDGLLHLSVPVARDRRGALRIDGYPALVGGPSVEREDALDPSAERQVPDESLRTVVERALGNYLAHEDANLLADLTPGAVVTLPDARLRLLSVDSVAWAVPNRRVAVELRAADGAGTTLTLRYEVDVRASDRWLVQSIHINSPSGGGN